MSAFQSSCVALVRVAGLIDYPVPPNSSIRHYYSSGVSCALPIATMALHHGVPLLRARTTERVNVLDFGCGSGRELLQFTRQFPNPQYFGCDADAGELDFLRKQYPGVKTASLTKDPVLPYPDQTMDAVYSVSTMRRFHPQLQLAWLKELHRVTRIGGMCFLSTDGFQALASFGVKDSDRWLLERGILHQEEDGFRTVVSPEYIRRTWPQSGFRVVDVIEGIISGLNSGRQDLVVLRRSGRV